MSNAALVGELVEERAVISTAQLQELAARINTLDRQAVAAMTTGLEQAIQTGEALTEAKKIVGHGKWLVWLAENCPTVSHQSASKYMRIYEGYRDGQLRDIAPGCNLSINSVIAALSSPRRGTPDPTVNDTDDEGDVTYPDDRLRLARRAVDAIMEIEQSPAFKGMLKRRGLVNALVGVLNSYDDDTWHVAYRALKSFSHASEDALKKVTE